MNIIFIKGKVIIGHLYTDTIFILLLTIFLKLPFEVTNMKHFKRQFWNINYGKNNFLFFFYQDPPETFTASNVANFPYDLSPDATPVTKILQIDGTTSGNEHLLNLANTAKLQFQNMYLKIIKSGFEKSLSVQVVLPKFQQKVYSATSLHWKKNC